MAITTRVLQMHSEANKLSLLWLDFVRKNNLANVRGKICLPGLLGVKFQRTEEAANSQKFGISKMWKASLRLEIWPYIDPVKKIRPGIAPKSGISNRWLCQPCFTMAVRIAEANRVVY